MLGATNPFEARGLDPELAAKLGAGIVNGMVAFDYLDRGVLQYRKFRTREKRFFIKPEGRRKRLWLLDVLRELLDALPDLGPDAFLVIVEGEHDAITAVQIGAAYVVSVPNGSCSKRTRESVLVRDDAAFDYLWGDDEKLIPEIDRFSRIILAVDGDEAGMILRDELAIRIGEERCWCVSYPERTKDLNDVLLRYGPEAARKVLRDAKPMRPGHLIKPSEIPPSRFVQAYTTGLTGLDPLLKIVRPEFIVVTGVPSSGKGVFIRSMCYRLAERYGLKTAFCTPEDPAHRLKREMLRFGMRASRHPTKEDQERSIEFADKHFRISSLPEDKDLTIDVLKSEMTSAVMEHDCQLFVMDPWNEICHDLGGLTETLYIEGVLPKITKHVRRLGLAMFIAAHPRKVAPGETVDLYHINGSANWRNKADHGIVLSRAEGENGEPSDVVEVAVRKTKDHETMGVPGKTTLRYNRDAADYEDVLR